MTRGEPGASATARAAGIARRAAPPVVRRMARSVLRRGAAPGAPLLSVVIPVYNVQGYLRECLDSALTQTMADLEVIAVDDGSTDSSPQILREYAARDSRVRVFSQTNSGQGIARNLGVSHARGTFLTFLDADDTVPPKAFGYLVRHLEESGSDFAVGAARRMLNGRFSQAPWHRAVHDFDRIGTTLDEFPAALQDVIACNRMFRTEFWVRRVGSFRGHIAYEDHVPMVTAYVRATKFDVLSGITYNWRQRENRTSTSQQKASLENLLDRIAVKQEAHELLVAEASDVAYDAWVARALEVDFPPFLGFALAGDDMYRNVLAAAYRTFLGRTGPAALEQVSFFQKVRGWLASEARWEDLAQAEEYFRLYGRVPALTARDGEVVPVLPEQFDFLQGAPERVLTLSVRESRLEASLDGVRWLDDTVLELTGWVLIVGLDTVAAQPRTTAALVDQRTGESTELAVEPLANPRPTQTLAHNVDYGRGGVRIRIDTAQLRPAAVTERSDWAVRLRVVAGGVAREGAFQRPFPGSSAVEEVARAVDTSGGPGRIIARFDSALGFAVRIEPLRVVTERLVVEGRTVSGILRAGADDFEPRGISAVTAEDASVRGRLQRAGAGRHEFAVELPPGAPRSWALMLREDRSVRARVAWPTDLVDQEVGRWGPGAVAAARERDGMVAVHSDAPLLRVTDVALAGTSLRLTVRHRGIDLAGLDACRITNENLVWEPPSVEEVDDGHAVLSFETRLSRFGGPLLAVPAGSYELALGLPHGTLTATPVAGLVDRLPVDLTGGLLRLTARLRRTGELMLVVGPPLADDEIGTSAQRVLQREFRLDRPPVRESLFLQSYLGEFATDSQRAVDEAVRLVRPDLPRSWGVADLGTEVPEGATPLLVGSRGWYDALGSSRYLCSNIDFAEFFVKQPAQRYLQTFHGYPFKSMGIGFWQGKGWGPDRIATEVGRRNRDWDQILVPSERCADFYRQEYRYEGDILVTGYPRTDFLVNADAGPVRSRVLQRLGIPEDKTVVLYAPTYRDHLTTRVYAARIFDELDLPRLSAGLGEDFVVLLRGHNNNQREEERRHDVARVVDVTDYPEINELTVAADVAVLDYSSLRFDWALTGKPMIFFVPDLEEYFAARPPLFPFEGSAPGPWVRTTDDVVDRVRDHAGVRSRHAADIDRFNADFNALHDGRATERVLKAFLSG